MNFQKEQICKWLPIFASGEEAVSPDPRTPILRANGVLPGAFDACLHTLLANGCEIEAQYAIGENRYALCVGEDTAMYLSHSAPAKELSLYIEARGQNAYPPTDDGVCGALAPVLWQLPCDCKGSAQNGGMSYVMRTQAGSFIIIDGGYYTAQEAEALYAFLRAHTPQGLPTVIDAWIITHLHWDHFGGMYAFSERYAEQIPVKAFYGHFDYLGHAAKHRESYFEATCRGLWRNAAHYEKLHTGMSFRIGGIDLQILYTPEELYPTTAEQYDFNNTSIVFCVRLGRAQVLFLGDVMREGTDWMLSHLPRQIFKSDAVQYSHHGYEGASQELYDAVAAPTVLWPMNIDGYQENYPTVPQNVFAIWHDKTACGKSYPVPNRYICHEAPYVKEILLGHEVQCFSHPHTFAECRLPDFDRIFENRTKRDTK